MELPISPEKLAEAGEIINKCIGPKGVWASPTRYQYQCWTRDFVIATEEFLLMDRPDKQLQEESATVARKHLEELSNRQYPDGRIPIMFIDNHPRWLAKKIWSSIKHCKISFLLRQYFSKDGIGQLSPWTRDSEVLYILGFMRYMDATRDHAFYDKHAGHVRRALDYVNSNLTKDGLIFGGDWRDTRPDLDDKFLLTNNCLLYTALKQFGGQTIRAETLRYQINDRLWTGTHYRDYIGVDDFDTLGNAFAILYDVAPPNRWPSIIKSASVLDTPYGYKLNGVTLPPKSKEETEVMLRTNQFGVIWPFIHGYMILALLKAGEVELATRQFKKWTNLEGFYEFYDPTTGKGHGSVDQVWSAALYLRTARELARRTILKMVKK